MQNPQIKTWRICCRKLPPTLSEDEFLKTEIIANYITNNIISVKYYPAEAIGDTSAPASSMAMISITADDFTLKQFIDSLSQQTFKMTYCEPKTAQIEYAPCQGLSVRPSQQQYNNRQLQPIDKDPEFINFSSKFEESFVPLTDAMLDKSIVDEDDEMKAKFNYNINVMSQKLNGGNIKNSGPKSGNNDSRGGKRKKSKNKNRYNGGDGNHQ